MTVSEWIFFAAWLLQNVALMRWMKVTMDRQRISENALLDVMNDIIRLGGVNTEMLSMLNHHRHLLLILGEESFKS